MPRLEVGAVCRRDAPACLHGAIAYPIRLCDPARGGGAARSHRVESAFGALGLDPVSLGGGEFYPLIDRLFSAQVAAQLPIEMGIQ